jgi:hypothetical protein
MDNVPFDSSVASVVVKLLTIDMGIIYEKQYRCMSDAKYKFKYITLPFGQHP